MRENIDLGFSFQYVILTYYFKSNLDKQFYKLCLSKGFRHPKSLVKGSDGLLEMAPGQV